MNFSKSCKYIRIKMYQWNYILFHTQNLSNYKIKINNYKYWIYELSSFVIEFVNI